MSSIEPNDGEWRRHIAREYARLRKSPSTVAAPDESPWLWLNLGLAGPWIALLPLVYGELIILGWLNDKFIHYDGNSLTNWSPRPNVLEDITLALLALCALPCGLGLYKYNRKAFVLMFSSGYATSFFLVFLFLSKKLIPALYHP